jgi:hypothetical protein
MSCHDVNITYITYNCLHDRRLSWESAEQAMPSFLRTPNIHIFPQTPGA